MNKVVKEAEGAEDEFRRPARVNEADLTDPERNAVRTIRKVFFRMGRAKALEKRATLLDDRLRHLNLSIFAIALLGLVMQIINNEVCWDAEFLVVLPFTLCAPGVILSSISFACSLIAIVFLCFYYASKAIAEQLKWDFKTPSAAFWQTSLKWFFFIELLLLLVQPLPFEAQATESSVFLEPFGWGIGPKTTIVVVLLRVHYLLRTVRDFSTLYRNRSSFVDKQAGKGIKEHVHSFRVVKVYYLRYAVQMILAFFLGSWFLFSYVIYILEREHWWPNDDNPMSAIEGKEVFNSPDWHIDDWSRSPFSDFFNCLWFTGVTMMTVGYGDITPVSVRGRLFALLSAFVGVIITSLVVGTLTQNLAADPFEEYLLQHLKKNNNREERQEIAARIIQIAWAKYKEQKRARLESERGHQPKSPKTTSVAMRARPYLKKLHKLTREAQEWDGSVVDGKDEEAAFDEINGAQASQGDLARLERKLDSLIDSLPQF